MYYSYALEHSENYNTTEIRITNIIGDISIFISTNNSNSFPHDSNYDFKYENNYRELLITLPIDEKSENTTNYYIALEFYEPSSCNFYVFSYHREYQSIILENLNPITCEFKKNQTLPIYFYILWKVDVHIELIPITGKFELYLVLDNEKLTTTEYDYKSEHNFLFIQENETVFS